MLDGTNKNDGFLVRVGRTSQQYQGIAVMCSATKTEKTHFNGPDSSAALHLDSHRLIDVARNNARSIASACIAVQGLPLLSSRTLYGARSPEQDCAQTCSDGERKSALPIAHLNF